MSRGDLQEMEAGTKQSKTAVNSGALQTQHPMPKHQIMYLITVQ